MSYFTFKTIQMTFTNWEPHHTFRLTDTSSILQPQAILDRRTLTEGPKTMEHVLIQWNGLPPEEATSESLSDLEGTRSRLKGGG